MTVTTTTLNLVGKNIPYIGAAPTQDQWQSIIPRAEKIYGTTSSSVTVAGAGNEQSLVVKCVLPEGFGYALVESSISLFGADIADWTPTAFAEMVDSVASPSYRDTFIADGSGIWATSTTALGRTYRCHECPSKIVIPAADGGQLIYRVFNSTQDGVVMTCYAYFRFLVFDLNQAYFWAVNTPIPTR